MNAGCVNHVDVSTVFNLDDKRRAGALIWSRISVRTCRRVKPVKYQASLPLCNLRPSAMKGLTLSDHDSASSLAAHTLDASTTSSATIDDESGSSAPATRRLDSWNPGIIVRADGTVIDAGPKSIVDEIPGYPVSISSIKRSLAEKIPKVRPSDRIEAFARGVGFRTYASLRAALDESECFTPSRRPDGKAFADYIGGAGYDLGSDYCIGVFWSSLGNLPPEWNTKVDNNLVVTQFASYERGFAALAVNAGRLTLEDNVRHYLRKK